MKANETTDNVTKAIYSLVKKKHAVQLLDKRDYLDCLEYLEQAIQILDKAIIAAESK